MADTIPQRIVNAVKSRFEGITIANGYRSDIGNKVTVWRTVQFEPGDKGLDIRDKGGPFSQVLSNVHEHELNLEAQIATSGTESDEDLRKMVADVIQAIGAQTNGHNGRYWNDGSVNLAVNTELVDDSRGVRQNEYIDGDAVVKFKITYRFRGFDNETLA